MMSWTCPICSPFPLLLQISCVFCNMPAGGIFLESFSETSAGNFPASSLLRMDCAGFRGGACHWNTKGWEGHGNCDCEALLV